MIVLRLVFICKVINSVGNARNATSIAVADPYCHKGADPKYKFGLYFWIKRGSASKLACRETFSTHKGARIFLNLLQYLTNAILSLVDDMPIDSETSMITSMITSLISRSAQYLRDAHGKALPLCACIHISESVCILHLYYVSPKKIKPFIWESLELLAN